MVSVQSSSERLKTGLGGPQHRLSYSPVPGHDAE